MFKFLQVLARFLFILLRISVIAAHFTPRNSSGHGFWHKETENLVEHLPLSQFPCVSLTSQDVLRIYNN